MAHHQGMALVALGNVLNDRVMVERFHADPIVEATELLLQERMPRDVLVARPRAEEVKSAADVRDLVPPVLRRFTSPHDAIPRTHLLSNGRYAVMVTAAGSGYSRWRDVAVTRWREDVTRDSWGSYLFLRDMHTGAVWSAGHQPSGAEADSYEVTYAEDRAEFSRRDGSIATGLTIVVSAEHDAEIRRVSLTNLGSHERADRADVVRGDRSRAAGGRRRPPGLPEPVRADRVRPRDRRAPGDPPPAIRRRAADLGRARRGGRGARPAGSSSTRRIAPASSVGAARSARRSRSSTGVRSRTRSARCWTRSSASAAGSGSPRARPPTRSSPRSSPSRARRSSTWPTSTASRPPSNGRRPWPGRRPRSSSTTSGSSPTRPTSSSAWPTGSSTRTRRCGRRRPCWPATSGGRPALWAHGISGDLPIVLVRIDEAEDLDIVRQLLRAHEYWRLKLLDVDLVILNEHGATYAQDLHDSLESPRADEPVHPGPRRPSGPRRGLHPARRPALRTRTARCSRAPPGPCC